MDPMREQIGHCQLSAKVQSECADQFNFRRSCADGCFELMKSCESWMRLRRRRSKRPRKEDASVERDVRPGWLGAFDRTVILA